MNTSPSQSGHSDAQNDRLIEIDLLALDLSQCTRCLGTLVNIERAIDAVKPALYAMGTDARFRKTVIDSEEQAHQYRFVSSPTVRINGQDIVFETRESKCDSCTDLCGCPEGTSCRVWRYHGKEYTEAPVALVVEALLKHMRFTGTPAVATLPDEGVPENLQRFFASRSRRRIVAEPCCSPQEQDECCDPDNKASCCGGPDPKSCGCR
jgi:hypothetical protein